MNDQERIFRALDEIAQEAIPVDKDLWPGLQATLTQPKRVVSLRRVSTGWIIVIFALIIILLTSAAYAYYRLRLDPGLENVQDLGLVTQLELQGTMTLPTPVSTILPTTQTSSASSSEATPSTEIARETVNGVTVILDWAYIDDSRIAYQFTVRGMQDVLSDTIDISTIVSRTALVTDPLPLTGTGGDSGISAGPGDEAGTVVVNAEQYLKVPAQEGDEIRVSLDISLGDVEVPIWETGPDGQPLSENSIRMVYVPLIATFHFDFTLPFYPSVTIEPELSVAANGINMTLEWMKVSPSSTEVSLCYDLPTRDEWEPEATLKIGDFEPVSISIYSSDGPANDARRCVQLSFPAPYERKPTLATLTIDRLVTPKDYFANAETARQKLAEQGIIVEFHVDEYSANYEVLSTPEGMSDEELYRLIGDSLREIYPGPWIFSVRIP